LKRKESSKQQKKAHKVSLGGRPGRTGVYYCPTLKKGQVGGGERDNERKGET